MDSDTFKKLVDILERSIEWMARVSNDIQQLYKSTEWAASELKELVNRMRENPCIIKSYSFHEVKEYFKDEIEEREKEHNTMIETMRLINENRERDLKLILSELKSVSNAYNIYERWTKIATVIITLVIAALGVLIYFKK